MPFSQEYIAKMNLNSAYRLLIIACFLSLIFINYLENNILHVGLFLFCIIACVFLRSQKCCRCVHVNPHVHVVYAAFCMYKISPWKTNLGILNGPKLLINFNLIVI